jgi:hypothetical protein
MRHRHEAMTDWLGLAYRASYVTLVTAPLWGTVIALAILWQRAAV